MDETYQNITIGGKTVKRIGLGTNRLKDTGENREFIKDAVKLGLNFIDTANIYQNGESEQTIGGALSPFPENVLITTKGGMVRGADADNSAEHLNRMLDESLARLKAESIDLYQLHRVNEKTPIEDTMRVFTELQNSGKIKHMGLSNVTIEHIERALKITEIASVQNHYSIAERKNESVLEYCEKNNIVFIPYFPLGKGNIPSHVIVDIADKYNITPHQVSLAWLLMRSPVMLPIPGTLSIKHLGQNLNSLNIKLSQEDFDTIDKLNLT